MYAVCLCHFLTILKGMFKSVQLFEYDCPKSVRPERSCNMSCKVSVMTSSSASR